MRKKNHIQYHYLRYASILWIINISVSHILMFIDIDIWSNLLKSTPIAIIQGLLCFLYFPMWQMLPAILSEGDIYDRSIVIRNIEGFKYSLLFIITLGIGPPLVFLLKYDKIIYQILNRNHQFNKNTEKFIDLTEGETESKYRFWYHYTKFVSILNIIQVLFILFVYILKINLPEYIVMINIIIFICYIPANIVISSILNEESDMPYVVKTIMYIIFFIFTFTVGPSLIFLFKYDKLMKKMINSNTDNDDGDVIIELTDIAEDDTKNTDQKNRNR